MFTSPEIRDRRSVNTYKSQVKKGKDTRKSTMIVIPVVKTGDWEKVRGHITRKEAPRLEKLCKNQLWFQSEFKYKLIFLLVISS